MKILVGSLGTLGFLVKKIVPRDGDREWSVFRDEAALTSHLAAAAFSDAEIRTVLRRVRRDGRAILGLPPGGPGVVTGIRALAE